MAAWIKVVAVEGGEETYSEHIFSLEERNNINSNIFRESFIAYMLLEPYLEGQGGFEKVEELGRAF